MTDQDINRSEGIPNARFEPARYYRPGDAALSVIASRGSLATWRWAGRGPRYTKFGHRILYLGADLNAWLDMHLVEPTIRATTKTSRPVATSPTVGTVDEHLPGGCRHPVRV